MNTPRTQAATLTGSIVTISHLCCQLETELDAMTKDRDCWKDISDDVLRRGEEKLKELKAEREKVQKLADKWRDDAAWLERLNGRLEPYNAYTADAIRSCRAELIALEGTK